MFMQVGPFIEAPIIFIPIHRQIYVGTVGPWARQEVL